MQVVQSKMSLLKLANYLDIVCAKINKQYVSDFYQPFQKVDRLSYDAIALKGIYVLEMIDKLRFELHDIDVRFGISYVTVKEGGQLNISQATTLVDKALEQLSQYDDYGNAKITIKLGHQNSLEKMFNESLRLCDFIQSRWRKSQYDLVSYLILNYGYMDTFIQKDVANYLKLSPQNLNQQLKNSGYYNLIRMKRELTVVLEQFRRSLEN